MVWEEGLLKATGALGWLQGGHREEGMSGKGTRGLVVGPIREPVVRDGAGKGRG